jgi:transcriptional regulator with PAS, ATPase and Fis domain
MEYITQDPRLLKVIDNLKEIAKTDTNVLLTGESGTGKTHMAREIFKTSNENKDSKFVIINCAAIPENLLESELFGYKKGAFTDAKENREGLIEAANGGTILFDEIGDMPLQMQAKILDVIQEKRYKKLGDSSFRNADIRIISSTNKALEQEIYQKNFREDLYYRLSVINFTISPLRERKGDIPLLVNHFITKFASKYNKMIDGIDKNTLNIFLEYEWPGNIRELENTIERAVLLEKRNILSNFNLPLHLKKMSTSIYLKDSIKNSLVSQYLNTSNIKSLPTLDDLENTYIQRIYELVEGNKSKTAAILGIDRSTLYKKLKILGID